VRIEDARVYVIAPARVRAGRLADVIGTLGADIVQLRDKQLGPQELLAEARACADAARRAGCLFIVNDDPELARAAGADGVHLGQDDLPARLARPLLRPGMLLGISTHDVAQAHAARDAGADYVAVGSMFATTTKADFQLVGPALVRKLRPDIRVALVGIGGITHDNVADVIRAGADGVAVISAVCGAPDPAAAARRFLEIIRDARPS
jgi:thiamine-phosphate pyrophosphorylase